VSGENRLEHIWKITLHSGTSHQLWVRAKCDPESAFNFSYSTSPTGDYTSIFNFSETSYDHKIKNFAVDENLDGVVYIKVSAANLSGESLKEISIDSIVVESFDPTLQPFGTGDAMKKGQPTNFALYGASHAGILGAVVETTNIEGILQLDLLATDYYRDEAYPTYLYYNPYKTTKYINLDIGYDAVDIYETTSQSMLIRNATGTIQLSIPPESAIVTVLAPSGGEVSISDNKKMIDNVIVDYRTNNSFLDCPQMQASPFRYTADLTGDCKVGMADLVSLAECWLKQDDGQCRGYDISDDGIINMRDYSYISDQWGQKHDF
jgi:hypothetical protein